MSARPRSPETQVRDLRFLLRHARHALDELVRPEARPPGYTQEDSLKLARCVLGMVDRELAPRRPRRRTR